MAGAKKGSQHHLDELQQRTANHYSLAILDVFLGHLKEPDTDKEPGFHQLNRASICLLALLDVIEACKLRPSLSELSVQKLLPALQGIVHWAHLVLSLRRDEWSEGSNYTIQDFTTHENFLLALLGLTEMHETLHQAVTSDLRVIELCVMSWVATHGKVPLLYAGGNHRNCHSVDAIISLVSLISSRSPMELAGVILSGRICSPGLFFLRGSQRMWMLLKPDIIPNICHVEEIPIDSNMAQLTLIVDTLVDTHPDLVVPMLETLTPAYFMDALVKVRVRSSLFTCHVGRIHFLEHILDCAVRVCK